MRHDRRAYLTTARPKIRDLEESLRRELEAEGWPRDAGWDTESLRAEFGRPSEE
jgi:hypothetical protein